MIGKEDLTQFPLSPIVVDAEPLHRHQNEKPSLTVASLIKLLQTLPPDLPLGFEGHFGEFAALHPEHLEMKWDWRGAEPWETRKARFLAINAPDFGPDPD